MFDISKDIAFVRILSPRVEVCIKMNFRWLNKYGMKMNSSVLACKTVLK